MVLLALMVGCRSGGLPSADTDTDGETEPLCAADTPVARRLSHFEYDNTVRDLLGTARRPSVAFPPDAEVLAVSRLLAEGYQSAAEDLAAEARDHLERVVPCDAAATGCDEEFVRAFARRAYRRPPTEDEVQRLLAVHRGGADFADGVALVVEVVLQSPQFLYMHDTLTTRLSYLLWGSMPDEALLAAELPADLDAQVDRMLAGSRARDNVAHFHARWLGLDAAPDHLVESAQAFTDAIFWSDGTLEDLLTADGGVLTQPAIMAALAKPDQTHPIKRGLFVREQLLCQTPPPPPPDVNVAVPTPEPGVSTRERFAQHTADPACAGCHALIDPIGFAFEHYDENGDYRTQDGGRPIDASGELIDTDVDGPFVGAAQLAERLAASQQVSDCMVTQWFTYAHGRPPTEDDACVLEELQRRFEESGRRLSVLPVALADLEADRWR